MPSSGVLFVICLSDMRWVEETLDVPDDVPYDGLQQWWFTNACERFEAALNAYAWAKRGSLVASHTFARAVFFHRSESVRGWGGEH
jgi:hypothetical protein